MLLDREFFVHSLKDINCGFYLFTFSENSKAIGLEKTYS